MVLPVHLHIMNSKEAAQEAPKGRMDVFEGLDPEVRDRTKKMLMYFILFAVVMLFAGFKVYKLDKFKNRFILFMMVFIVLSISFDLANWTVITMIKS